jgi:DNA-binding Lrp family transcriptional regulator
MQFSAIEKRLIDGWQRGFPLVERPYAAIAKELGIREEQVIDMLASLKKRGILSRAGAVVRPNTAGASTLVAMKVAPERLDEVAATVSAEASVNHNYEREHELNLWFVVTEKNKDQLKSTLERLERKTGCRAIDLPLQRAYHIDLGFALWASLNT